MIVWMGVMVLGGAGAVCRFLVDRAVTSALGRPFPFGTLVVNASGAFVLGFLGGVALSPHLALLFGVGFIGSYTTFSTWMLETQRLAEERRGWPALGNIGGSVVVGLTAAGTGLWLGGMV